ncbi:hypothetical protein [Pelagicoccus sp. SDUM812003]|uniref:hypothetical protein n=1 Tax=Pelagicoccus sp. SDUM812003 TaxID=3041267 RepID=UPI00280CCB3D|nr:hypothetical protein [Pelagicoccus sp. SDUM812003]MDQ8203944.1 hypothetical protein [Pelagicoccus sp. SDUM812003]
MKMNETTITRLRAIGIATTITAATATLVMPAAAGVLAGLTIAGALFEMGLMETRKRAY